MNAETLCRRFAGSHYRDRAFQQAAAPLDWKNRWPVIDRAGNLTGIVIDSAEADEYWNVNDQAMISAAEAKAGGWRVDADWYATEPNQEEGE